MIKEIVVNEEDLYKFYRKLPLYRSLFYKKITFKSNNKKITDIIISHFFKKINKNY